MDGENSRVVFPGEAGLRVIVGGVGQAACRSRKRTTSQNTMEWCRAAAHASRPVERIEWKKPKWPLWGLAP